MPELIAVGAQSTGKSTLLEALVGQCFIPRGEGPTTRRPMRLQLEFRSEQEQTEFIVNGESFTSPEGVRDAISSMQPGRDERVMEEDFTVIVRGSNIPMLTLIDLPGLIMETGDEQHSEEARDIDRVVKKYIRQPNVVPLSLTGGGGADWQSHAVHLIRREGKPDQSIGVYTMMDCARGQKQMKDIASFLKGNSARMGYGNFAVNCAELDPTQQQNSSSPLEQELNWFRNPPSYDGGSPFNWEGVLQRCGVGHLSQSLGQILSQRVCNMVPKLRSNAEEQRDELDKELAKLPDPPAATEESMKEFVGKL